MVNNDLKDITILYAEDEDLIRESVSMLLKRRVKEVVMAENGQIALNKFNENKPDILVTDLQMPIMTGMELAKQIRQVDPDFPIVVISAYNDESHQVPEASGRLLKPVQKNELLEVIANCVGSR